MRTQQINPEVDGQNQVLLAAFERPPEATGPAPASTILIAAESQTSYPALKTAEDYFAPLTEVLIAKGFQAVGDPYVFPLGTTRVAREDFSRKQKDRPTMYQSTLVALSHGAILSFTFLASREEEVDSLIENLSFRKNPAPKSAPARKPKSPEKHPS